VVTLSRPWWTVVQRLRRPIIVLATQPVKMKGFALRGARRGPACLRRIRRRAVEQTRLAQCRKSWATLWAIRPERVAARSWVYTTVAQDAKIEIPG